MPSRFALCTSLTIALLALPASALAADVVVPSSVARSTAVPSGGSKTLTLRCPAEAVALNAAVTNHDPGVTVGRSIPGRAAGRWSFRLTGAGGGGGVRAVLRCVRLRLPAGVGGARLDVSTRRPPVVVPAGGRTTVRLRCGRAWVGTGYGFDPGTRGDTRLASVVPRAHGWDFTIANAASTPATARVSARCLRQTVTSSRGARLRFGVARLVFSDLIGRMPGSAGTFTHTCAESRFSLATGYAVDEADEVQLRLTHPEGRRAGRFRFRGAASDDVVTTFLVCLSRRTQFR
jgi:hypothetical protein